MIAPDSNRSATARSITTREPLWVDEIEFEDGTTGFATDGTPGGLRAFRRARPGRVPARADRLRHQPRLQPRRRHHLLGHGRGRARGHRAGHPGDRRLAAVAQGRDGLPARREFDFDAAAAFTARLVEEIDDVGIPEGTLLNVNCPAGDVRGARACRLGKRIYRDKMQLTEEEEGRAALPHLRRRPVLPRGGGHRLRRDRRRLHRGHAAALRPDRRGGHRAAAAASTSTGCSRPAARRGYEQPAAERAPTSCGGSSSTTTTATTSSTTRRSATPSTTRC